jgi:hypothetical protein
MSGEKVSDERPKDACTIFRVEVFYNIIDTAIESINNRFIPNKDLYMDCSWLNPKKYPEIAEMKNLAEFGESTFEKLSELTGLNRMSLLEELRQLAGQYENLTKNWRNLYEATVTSAEDQNEDHEDIQDSDLEDEIDTLVIMKIKTAPLVWVAFSLSSII